MATEALLTLGMEKFDSRMMKQTRYEIRQTNAEERNQRRKLGSLVGSLLARCKVDGIVQDPIVQASASETERRRLTIHRLMRAELPRGVQR